MIKCARLRERERVIADRGRVVGEEQNHCVAQLVEPLEKLAALICPLARAHAVRNVVRALVRFLWSAR
jgi:hypothetical protein